MNDTLSWLEEFYSSLCDGDWEHQWGITISTLDNPGWSVKIDLVNTLLENLTFSEVSTEQDANHWVFCRVRNNIFEGAGGVHDLQSIFEIFRAWYDTVLSSKTKNGVRSE